MIRSEDTFSNDVSALDTAETLDREKKRDNDRLLSQTQEQSQSNIFFILFALLFGLKGQTADELKDNEFINKVSDSFNLNVDKIVETSMNVSNGSISIFEGAKQLSESVKPVDVDWSKANEIDLAELIKNDGPSVLNPDLIERMESDPKVKQMVQWTFDAAEKEGIDGTLLANQFWQESRFDPNAVSPAGAQGVAQFMPFHEGKWGLEDSQDFFDPKASINAGAKFMAHLTEKTGSQQLALVAYNGGQKAIEYVEDNTNGDMTIDTWMKFMAQERAEKGEGTSNLWRNETFNYVKKIDSAYWGTDTVANAEAKTTELTANFDTAKTTTQPLDTDPKQPVPLMLAFNGNEGVNEIKTAATIDFTNFTIDDLLKPPTTTLGG